jgi:hypothetical protein
VLRKHRAAVERFHIVDLVLLRSLLEALAVNRDALATGLRDAAGRERGRALRVANLRQQCYAVIPLRTVSHHALLLWWRMERCSAQQTAVPAAWHAICAHVGQHKCLKAHHVAQDGEQ